MAGKFNLSDHLQPARRDIGVITDEVLAAKRAAGDSLLTLGQRLIEAKAMLPHGEWLPWLEGQVGFSERAAQQYMKLAQTYTNPQALADLGATKALMLLALPDGEREEFIEVPHAVDGEEKTVQDMSSRELKQVLRERDEAKQELAKAEADRQAAEAAREKISADMDAANHRLEGLNGELEQSRTEARQEAERAEKLERELAELRSRPVEVAVEADQEAVAKAREETRAKVEAEFKLARKEAQRQVAAANEAAAHAKTELDQARREIEDLQFEVKRAENADKRAIIAANEDLLLFRTIFEQVQEQINKLTGVLLKVRAKDAESAEKLQRMLLALSDKVREAAK